MDEATGAEGGAAAPWYGTVADDVKGYIENKGWDSPDKAIASYRNLETLVGAEKAGRTFLMPKDENDAEGWKALHAKLGVPENPEGYKLAVPEGQSDGFAKHMAPILHKLGIPAKAAEGLVGALNEYAGQQQAAAQAAAEAKVAEQMTALQQEWGGQFATNAALGQRFVQSLSLELGWDAEATAKNLEMLESAWGSAPMMKFMAAAGKMLGEGRFAEGGQGAAAPVSKQAAQARLDQLMQDGAWLAKWAEGDAAAKAEKDRLDLLISQAA